MVGAIGNEANQCFALIENRADDCDIRQVRAAVAGMVRDDHVSRVKRLAKRDRTDAEPQCTQMNRDMWRVSNEPTFVVEQRTGIIESFFYVGGHGCALQELPHFFDNRVETAREQLQFDHWRMSVG